METLPIERQIEATQTLITASYDLVSGGLPHHAFMLEALAAGRTLNHHGKATFLSLNNAGLLELYRLTHYPRFAFAEERKAHMGKPYFGEEFEQYISRTKERLAEMLMRGIAGHSEAVRLYLKSSNHPDGPLSLEELTEILNQRESEGYSLDRNLPEQELMGGPPVLYTALVPYVMANFDTPLSLKTMEIFDKIDMLWFIGALFETGTNLHISKLELMARIFQHALTKAEELGIADPHIFDPKLYFRPPHSQLTAAGLNASFQKNFGIPVPSGYGLLDWANSALAAAKAKYLGAEAAKA